MSTTHRIDNVLVGSIVGETSDHKIIVSYEYDKFPDYLFNKISNDSVIKLVADEDEIGKFKFIINTHDSGGSSTDKGEIYRCIGTYSQTQIDSTYNHLHDNDEAYVLVFPITISLGEIHSLGIYFKNKNDIVNVDKMEIAIVSNNVSNLNGSKVEFAVSYYGPNDPNNTCRPGEDYKTFIVNRPEDLDTIPNISVSDYRGIFDSNMNYHYVVMFIHSSTNDTPLLAKDCTGILTSVGANSNFMFMIQNKTSIYTSGGGIINKDTMNVDVVREKTNMEVSVPYIEFYQLRNLGLNGDTQNAYSQD